MPPHYAIVHLFAAPQGHLVEIRRLDLPIGTAKHLVYHWLWIDRSAVVTFHFQSMGSSPLQRRRFEQAELTFDDTRGELRWNSGDVVALRATSQVLPESLHHRIQQHLS